MDVDIKSVQHVDPIPIQPLTIEPLTIADVQKIAPAAVHIKELNQIAPLLVESLRVDHIRHIDPVRIDRLNVTHLPTVNLTLSQLPALDLNVRRVPPVAIAVQQQFDLCSRYVVRTKLLGFEVARFEIDGKTKVVPKDCARREQFRSHERSAPDVAAAGNPAIPTRIIETCAEAVTRTAPPPCAEARLPNGGPIETSYRYERKRAPLHAGVPRFNYSLSRMATAASPITPSGGSAVSFGR